MQAFQQLPLSGESLVCIGNAYFHQGNYEEAIEYFLRSAEIREDSGTYNNLGVALKKVGLLQDAIDAFNNSLSLTPNNEAAVNLLTLYIEIDKKTEAKKLINLCSNFIPQEDIKKLMITYEQQFPLKKALVSRKNTFEFGSKIGLSSNKATIKNRLLKQIKSPFHN